MVRRSIAVVCVVALVVTAGCSGVFGGPDDGSRDPFTVPETTAGPTTTAGD